MTVSPCAAVWDDGGRGLRLRRRVDSQDQKQVTAMFLSELTNKVAELCGRYRCLVRVRGSFPWQQNSAAHSVQCPHEGVRSGPEAVPPPSTLHTTAMQGRYRRSIGRLRIDDFS
jgi:hypothetical protein